MANKNILTSSSQSRRFINTHPSATEPSSSLYIARTSELNANGSESHTVTGMQLIFKANQHLGSPHFPAGSGYPLPGRDDEYQLFSARSR